MKLISDVRLQCATRWEVRSRKLVVLLLLIGPVCCQLGCQQRAANKLQGRWVGRPDTSAARATRESEKFGSTSNDLAQIGAESKASESAQATDWENYDATVHIDFASSERVEMSLDDRKLQAGRWKIVSTSPAGCAIEIQTELEGAPGEPPSVERRRFELLMDEREGECVGFLLTEAGADRQQGAIYFRRPQNTAAAHSL